MSNNIINAIKNIIHVIKFIIETFINVDFITNVIKIMINVMKLTV